jgi:hypothetical protein
MSDGVNDFPLRRKRFGGGFDESVSVQRLR